MNYKLPWLTKKELGFFKDYDREFFKRFNLNRSLREKIASSLHTLAVKKLLGFGGFEKNKSEAIKHHLKACKYNPCLVCKRPNFRKEVGLLVYERCETDL